MKLTKKLVKTGGSKSKSIRQPRTNAQDPKPTVPKPTVQQAYKRQNPQTHMPTGPRAHNPTGSTDASRRRRTAKPNPTSEQMRQRRRPTHSQLPGRFKRNPALGAANHITPQPTKRTTTPPTTQPTKRNGASLSVEDVVRDHIRIIAPRAHTDTTNNMTKKFIMFKKMDDIVIMFNTIQNSTYVESKGLSLEFKAISELINASEIYYRSNINTFKEKYYNALENNYKALEENEMTPTSFKDNYMIAGFGGTQEFKKQGGNPSLNDKGKKILLNRLDNLLEILSRNLEVYKKLLVDKEQPKINELIGNFRKINNEKVRNEDTLEASARAEILRKWNIISTTNVAVLMSLNKDRGRFLLNYHIKQSDIVRIRTILENQMILLIQKQQTFAHSTRMRDAHNAVAGTELETTSDESSTPKVLLVTPPPREEGLAEGGITPAFRTGGLPREE
jgi:hypothetical protein